MRRWKPPTPKLGRDAVILALVTLTAGALVWIAGHERQPERPEPPQPPDAAATVTTARALPADPETLVPPRAAAPSPPPPGPEPPTGPERRAEPEPAVPDIERAESSPPPRSARWAVIDAERYNLTPATVPLYARLPGAYEWPLPGIERLEPICFRQEDEPGHVGIMRTTDGRLFHWGEERRYLQEHLDADHIDSTEIRTAADPGAFIEPLRAAAHGACARSLHESRPAAWRPFNGTTAPKSRNARANSPAEQLSCVLAAATGGEPHDGRYEGGASAADGDYVGVYVLAVSAGGGDAADDQPVTGRLKFRCSLDPAQGGLGDALAAAPRSRCCPAVCAR